MLVLLFNLGPDRYGIDVRQVVEIVPRLELRHIPNAPDFIAGLFRYRGEIVPVVDLQQLTQHAPCQQRLSTRIVIISYEVPAKGTHMLGLMAERVTEVSTIDDAVVKESHVTLKAAPYLGKMAMEGDEMIQLLNLNKILPAALANTLFAEVAEAE